MQITTDNTTTINVTDEDITLSAGCSHAVTSCPIAKSIDHWINKNTPHLKRKPFVYVTDHETIFRYYSDLELKVEDEIKYQNDEGLTDWITKFDDTSFRHKPIATIAAWSKNKNKPIPITIKIDHEKQTVKLIGTENEEEQQGV